MPKPKIKTVETLAKYTLQSRQDRKYWKRFSNKLFRRMDKDSDLRDADLQPKKRPTKGWQD